MRTNVTYKRKKLSEQVENWIPLITMTTITALVLGIVMQMTKRGGLKDVISEVVEVILLKLDGINANTFRYNVYEITEQVIGEYLEGKYDTTNKLKGV